MRFLKILVKYMYLG